MKPDRRSPVPHASIAGMKTDALPPATVQSKAFPPMRRWAINTVCFSLA
jgi:hypothetical protein